MYAVTQRSALWFAQSQNSGCLSRSQLTLFGSRYILNLKWTNFHTADVLAMAMTMVHNHFRSDLCQLRKTLATTFSSRAKAMARHRQPVRHASLLRVAYVLRVER